MNIYLETYGCTANRSDERTALGLIRQANHTVVSTIADADVLLLLTCTVVDRTEQRMLSRIRYFHDTGKPLIVSGCMAAVQPGLITAIAPQARLLPPARLGTLPDLIANHPTPHPSEPRTRLPKYHMGVIAPLSIAEGCDYACAYCITHHARGPLQSYPIPDIIADVQSALAAGCREIQLTAQDTAAYGRDAGTSLASLLHNLCALPGSFFLRVGMMNPSSLTRQLEPLIDAYHNPKVYKFLHLPLQSGDDEILTRMNRKYTTTAFLHCVEAFRREFPDITLATDIIVGFPGETDQQSANTYDFLEALQPAVVNVTRYSARPQTTAKTLPHRITTQVMKERSRHLAAQSLRLAKQHNQQFLGRHFTILLTEQGKYDTVIGRTPNYKQVLVKGNHKLGTTCDVEIVDASPTSLFGKLI